MTQYFVLVDGMVNHGDFSVRVCVDGYQFLADNRFPTLDESLRYAHGAFNLPVIRGQQSDDPVYDLYRKLSA